MSECTLDLSITVVSHNQLRLLRTHLPSVFSVKSKSTFEIALIDNACTDGTADWVRRHLPEVRIIRNNCRKSYAANMNSGARALTKGRYFVALNPDIRCLPGLFDSAVAFMDANPDIGLLGPQLLNPDGTIQYSCRRFQTPLTCLIRGFHLDGVFKNASPIRNYLMTDLDHNSVADADWVLGALMVVRRQAIAEVGGMDERYQGAYSEDQDWCCRMWHAGWRVCYVPYACAVHDHQREGMRRPWSAMARIQVINAVRLMSKFGWRLSRKPRVQTA